MFRIACVVVLVTLATAANVHLERQTPIKEHVDLLPPTPVHWESFKSAFKRQYSQEEELHRQKIFSANLDYIQNHNSEADLGYHTYWVGLNEYADLTNEEFVSRMNGYKMSVTPQNGSTFLAPENIQLPENVDWRKDGYVTPVKNQLQCGSCWAFSSTGSLEGQHFKKTKKLVSLSEQNLVDCSTPEGNHGCQGGLMDQAFEYIKKNKGIDTEECYPYKGKNEKCHYKKSCDAATVTGYTDIPSGDEEALQKAVATVGPISVAIDASHISFQLYSHGVYNEPSCSSKKLDHGVLAVGYGTDGGKDYWLVKNSWGESWGLDGYIQMSRNKDNQCGIATQASYPLV